MKKIHLSNEPKTIPKLDAFPYQKEAFESIKDLEYAAIFHELVSPARVIVINFEILQVEKSQFTLYLKTRNVAIIIR